MAFVMRFAPQGMTAAKYEECIKRLEQAGTGSPEGRLYHVCFGDPNNLRVSDVWESREAFERFGQTLTPILSDLGFDNVEPEFFEVHNTIEGVKAGSAKP